jgi:3-hydroxyisobutyrate dehydrogenase-like beta-hydroxyacid dehydrogenase
VTTTGFLHPGAMGTTIAATCHGDRLWCSDGRSDATRARAESAGLVEARTLAEFVERSDTIVSVCPPGEAEAVAQQVAAAGFGGLYVDANAVAPATTARIGSLFERYVDGGIVGPPAVSAGTTRMYLSGDEAEAVSHRWDGSVLDVRPIEGGIGAASAVKMLFASWGKHNAALMLAISAVADAYGVTDAMRDAWEITRQPDFVEQSGGAAERTAPKAWRFEGEMYEIAATFEAAGLPPEFHRGAAEVYRRMAGFKDAAGPIALDDVVAALRPPPTTT